MGSDLNVRTRLLETEQDARDLDEFVVREAGELNRTWGEAVDLAELLSGDRHTKTWIAREFRDNGIVGFVALHRGRKKSDRHVAYLRLHVGLGYRRDGIGTQLLTRALAGAMALGITRVVATPYMHRDEYPSLFDRVGFKLEGVQESAVIDLTTGAELDVALLALLLPTTALR